MLHSCRFCSADSGNFHLHPKGIKSSVHVMQVLHSKWEVPMATSPRRLGWTENCLSSSSNNEHVVTTIDNYYLHDEIGMLYYTVYSLTTKIQVYHSLIVNYACSYRQTAATFHVYAGWPTINTTTKCGKVPWLHQRLPEQQSITSTQWPWQMGVMDKQMMKQKLT